MDYVREGERGKIINIFTNKNEKRPKLLSHFATEIAGGPQYKDEIE